MAEKWGLKDASFVGARSHIEGNFIFNGYNTVWTIDHDDGSQFYNDTANVLVWGGCKNYRGHSKSCDHNLILYPGIKARGSGGRLCQTDDNGIFANQYHHANDCFVSDGRFYSWGGGHGVGGTNETADSCTEALLAKKVYQTANNTLRSLGKNAQGAAIPLWDSKQFCGTADFKTWKALGQELGSTNVDSEAITVASIVALAKAKLGVK